MSATTLRPGDVIGGDFVVERALSSGGMGAVYVCLQTSTGKRRALKVMLPELMAHASLRDRFVQEAKVGARIDSDYIVDVLAAGLDPVPWLAMELLEGEDLARHVEHTGPLAFDSARMILEQACHALAAAHAAGVVHRDLKPENIFLGRSRRIGIAFEVKILDFGIAKITDEASTKAGKNTSAIGTRPWMAPEQATVGAGIGPQADVWALGLIAFFLLTGKYYWRAMHDPNANDMMLMMEVCMTGTLDPASERAALLGASGLLPAQFDGWFARCVVRDAEARFRDAGEAYQGLLQIAGGGAAEAGGVAVAGASVASPRAESAARPLSVVHTVMGEPLRTESSPSSPTGKTEVAPVKLTTPTTLSSHDSAPRRAASRRPLWIGVVAFVVAAPLGVWAISGAIRTPPPGSASVPISAASVPSSASSTPATERPAESPSAPPLESSAKYYVAIQVTNKTTRPSLEIEGLVREAMEKKLLSNPACAVAPRGETEQAAAEVIKSKKLTGYLLSASVEPFDYSGGALKVQLKVSMFTYPDRALKAEFGPWLKQIGTPSADPAGETNLMKLASGQAVDQFIKVANSL